MENLKKKGSLQEDILEEAGKEKNQSN